MGQKAAQRVKKRPNGPKSGPTGQKAAQRAKKRPTGQKAAQRAKKRPNGSKSGPTGQKAAQLRDSYILMTKMIMMMTTYIIILKSFYSRPTVLMLFCVRLYELSLFLIFLPANSPYFSKLNKARFIKHKDSFV
jgi:hypothetical protein